jgi:hypothetical protein
MKLCSICGVKNDRINQSYCARCHAEYMAIFRESPKQSKDVFMPRSCKSSLKKIQFIKSSVRKFTTKFIRAGLIVKKPCEVCQSEDVEVHHTNYLHPFEIKWLCAFHHNELHKNEKDTNNFGIPSDYFD